MLGKRTMTFSPRFLPNRLLLATTAVGLMTLLPRQADPHPHVWIDTVVKPQFIEGKLAAFEIDWTFDELYSFLVIDDFDGDKNGILDGDELESLAKASMSTLGSSNFFTRVTLDNEPVRNIEFENLTASTYLERISYHFTAKLEEPVDIRTRNLTFATYDENYYIEILLNEDDPVRFEGDWPKACRFEIGRDEVNRIYFDLVAPTVVRFPCLTS